MSFKSKFDDATMIKIIRELLNGWNCKDYLEEYRQEELVDMSKVKE